MSSEVEGKVSLPSFSRIFPESISEINKNRESSTDLEKSSSSTSKPCSKDSTELPEDKTVLVFNENTFKFDRVNQAPVLPAVPPELGLLMIF